MEDAERAMLTRSHIDMEHEATGRLEDGTLNRAAELLIGFGGRDGEREMDVPVRSAARRRSACRFLR
jgi:hypothetical protein